MSGELQSAAYRLIGMTGVPFRVIDDDFGWCLRVPDDAATRLVEWCETHTSAEASVAALTNAIGRLEEIRAALASPPEPQGEDADDPEQIRERRAFEHTLPTCERCGDPVYPAFGASLTPRGLTHWRCAQHDPCKGVAAPFSCRLPAGHEGRHIPVDVRHNPVDLRTLAIGPHGEDYDAERFTLLWIEAQAEKWSHLDADNPAAPQPQRAAAYRRIAARLRAEPAAREGEATDEWVRRTENLALAAWDVCRWNDHNFTQSQWEAWKAKCERLCHEAEAAVNAYDAALPPAPTQREETSRENRIHKLDCPMPSHDHQARLCCAADCWCQDDPAYDPDVPAPEAQPEQGSEER